MFKTKTYETDRQYCSKCCFGSDRVALIQGVVAGIGMAIFGVPGSLLWGALAGIADSFHYLNRACFDSSHFISVSHRIRFMPSDCSFGLWYLWHDR